MDPADRMFAGRMTRHLRAIADLMEQFAEVEWRLGPYHEREGRLNALAASVRTLADQLEETAVTFRGG